MTTKHGEETVRDNKKKEEMVNARRETETDKEAILYYNRRVAGKKRKIRRSIRRWNHSTTRNHYWHDYVVVTIEFISIIIGPAVHYLSPLPAATCNIPLHTTRNSPRQKRDAMNTG
jgi:hypothetical protein